MSALTGRLLIAADGNERWVPGFLEFHAGAANFPWRRQAVWIAAQLSARHRNDPVSAIAATRAVCRSDLYPCHLQPAGTELPSASDKLAGTLTVPTAAATVQEGLILLPDCFLDARMFDPADPIL